MIKAIVKVLDMPSSSYPQATARQRFAMYLAERIYRRVRYSGMGAYQRLRDYSTTPIAITKSFKPKRVPPEGFGQRYDKGYWEYREDVGLENDNFIFYNKGNAWQDWLESGRDPGTAGMIPLGFSDGRNAIVADEAINRGREDMLAANEAEVDAAAEAFLDLVLERTWGRKSQGL